MSGDSANLGEVYLSDAEEVVHQQNNLFVVSDSDPESDLEETMQPSTEAELNSSRRLESVPSRNLVRQTGVNSQSVEPFVSTNIPSSSGPAFNSVFARLGYDYRIPIFDPMSFSAFPSHGFDMAGPSGVASSSRAPLIENESPLSFESNPPEEETRNHQTFSVHSDSSSSSSSESSDESSSSDEEIDIVGSGDDSQALVPINLERLMVIVPDVGESSSGRKRRPKSKRVVKTSFQYKTDRIVPIGPLRDDAEINEDGIIPICSTTLTAKILESLYHRYEIPREYELILPDPSQTMYNPPEGCLTFHVRAFKCGWRLPMIFPIQEFFRRTGLCPTQVLPNALGTIMCFGVILALKKETFSYENFLSAFTISRSQGAPFFYFTVRRGYNFLDGYETSHSSEWWSEFFYVKHPSGNWNLPQHFRRNKCEILAVREKPAWLLSLGPRGVTSADRVEGEEDSYDSIGTKGSASLLYDTDPGLKRERRAVLGVGGADPTLFYPYALVVQPQMWLAGLTPTLVYCNNNRDLSKCKM